MISLRERDLFGGAVVWAFATLRLPDLVAFLPDRPFRPVPVVVFARTEPGQATASVLSKPSGAARSIKGGICGISFAMSQRGRPPAGRNGKVSFALSQRGCALRSLPVVFLRSSEQQTICCPGSPPVDRFSTCTKSNSRSGMWTIAKCPDSPVLLLSLLSVILSLKTKTRIHLMFKSIRPI